MAEGTRWDADPHADGKLFPPPNAPIPSIEPKLDVHGIGFEAGAALAASGASSLA